MIHRQSLDRGWAFRRLDDPATRGSPSPWETIDLPHTPFTPDLDGNQHWLGVCEYRHSVQVGPIAEGTRCTLFIGAAMHTAVVLVDGRKIAHHTGGYLGFEVDLTNSIGDGAAHELLLRLDNRDHPDVPPGKPFAELDFCWYGGLYRDVELRTYPAVHITEPLSAGEIAGGGLFARTIEATPESAHISLRTHVRNTGPSARTVQVHARLEHTGLEVAAATSIAVALAASGHTHVDLELAVARPALWSPDSPALYDLHVTVVDANGAELDARTERIGLRRIAFSRSGGFSINGRTRRLRGTNRHQEYPHAGYAAPRAAQWRDARRIKEAGFDYVRLSHYPQSPHFLDACDALGIVVMNAIPGWQYIGGPAFREACVAHARDLVRRDRNHACVVLWELSLNETAMDEAFMERIHAVGHEELPGDQMFTCGWIDHAYDVYIHARQHGHLHTWARGDKALVVSEYGDWEFYATNEGFDQTTGAGVLAAWSNSRHFRGEGERALRQQATNHTIALNDTLGSPAALDGQWAMFDYARGYDPERAAVGVMDVFRLPKFSYHFYRSQRDADERGTGWTGGPVVFIASHWTRASDLRVVVFSNCSEVELRLNGTVVGRSAPALTWMTQNLPHPPFVFDLPGFEPGRLEATGYVGGCAVAHHAVATPGPVAQIHLDIDTTGIEATPGEPDLLIAHARLLDADGTLCIDADSSIAFTRGGDAAIVGPTIAATEAGVASVVLRTPAGGKGFSLYARSIQNKELATICSHGAARNQPPPVLM